jgi:hypothetical protein
MAKRKHPTRAHEHAANMDKIHAGSLVDRQIHMAKTGMHCIQRCASTLQHGAALNIIKGTVPFTIKNAQRGLDTVAVRVGHPLLAGPSPVIFTPVPLAPQRRKGRR